MCHQDQSIRIGDKSHILPAGYRVYLSAPGVHYNGKYWKEPTRLLPERRNDSFAVQAAEKHADEDFHNAAKAQKASTVAADRTRQMRGTLLTFSDGARACLGRKFAQAEYVAFFAALLRQHRVCFADGTDMEQVRRDLSLKCAGKVTLAPLGNIRLTLKSRHGVF
jgi:cytochrome P450